MLNIFKDTPKTVGGEAGRARKGKAHVGFFCALSFLLTVPLMIYGYPWETFDSLFHFTSWVGYADALKNGFVLPSWYDQANYGLGEPRYIFYPPLSIILGGWLSFFLPAQLVAGTFIFLSSLLACYSSWLLGKDIFGYKDRVVVALLAAISFGIINDGLMRFAMAELLASSLLPLLILFFYKTKEYDDLRFLVCFSLITAVIWLIDVPLAVANAYVLGIVACWLTIKYRRPKILGKYLAAQFIAIILIGFYLVPAFFSKQYISADQLGFSAKSIIGYMMVSGRAILVGVISFLAILVFLGALFFKNAVMSKKGELILLTGIVGFLLQVPGIIDLFDLLPLAHTVGFSYRFYSYVSIAFPFVVFLFYRSIALRWGVGLLYCGFLIACVVSQYVLAEGSSSDRPDYFQSTQTVLASHERGFSGYPEYVPDGTGATMIEQASDAVKRQVSAVGEGCRASVEQWHAHEKQVRIISGSDCRIVLGTYDFPYWQAQIGDQPATHQTTDDGRIAVQVPAGQHDVTLRFVRPLWLTLSGSAITALGLIVAAYLWLRSRKGNHRRMAQHAT